MGVRTIVPPLNGAGTPRRGVPTRGRRRASVVGASRRDARAACSGAIGYAFFWTIHFELVCRHYRTHPRSVKISPDKRLPHDVPLWVDPQKSAYFITVNCQQRGPNQLARPAAKLDKTVTVA